MATDPDPSDREIVARQIGREPRAFRSVAVRCPFGKPAVTEQSPYGPNGEPFPTTYYVTCRHLVQAISRLEADGGVERWSEAVACDESLQASRAWADAESARIRKELAGTTEGIGLDTGVGGQSRSGSLKCLNAHAGFALAHPDYELGRRILAELPQLWPDRCCTGDA
jgi:hypothetical protein